MTIPSAIIFDHDGVLVDSEPVALDVWCRILDERRVPYVRAEIEGFIGLSDPDAHARIAGRPGMPGLEEFLEEFEQRRDARFVRELRPFPDAWEAVRHLAAVGVPLGIATNSTRDLLELCLEITGLGRYFAATAARTDVVQGKPAPDVYLEAASRLGVPAPQCLAIEDSATGAAAAKAAGMRVVTVARHGAGLEGFASMPSIDAGLMLTWMGRA